MSEPVDVLEVAEERLKRAFAAWDKATNATYSVSFIVNAHLAKIDLAAAEADLSAARRLYFELRDATDA